MVDSRIAVFAAAFLAAGSAQAQSTTITTGPDGGLSGSVSVPGLPSVGVQAGGGVVTTTPSAAPRNRSRTYAGPGRSLTVRSPDGSASSSVSVSGGNGVVAGAGSPGSRVTISPPARRSATPAKATRICPRGASQAYRQRTGCRLPTRR